MDPYGGGYGGGQGWGGPPDDRQQQRGRGEGQQPAHGQHGEYGEGAQPTPQYGYDWEQAAYAQQQARAARVPLPPQEEDELALPQPPLECYAAAGYDVPSYGYDAHAVQPMYPPEAYAPRPEQLPYPLAQQQGYAVAAPPSYDPSSGAYFDLAPQPGPSTPQHWQQPSASPPVARAGPSQVGTRRPTVRFASDLDNAAVPAPTRSYNFCDPVPADVRREQWNVRLSRADDYPPGVEDDGAPRHMISAYQMQQAALMRAAEAREAEEAAARAPRPLHDAAQSIAPYNQLTPSAPGAQLAPQGYGYTNAPPHQQERTTSALLEQRQQFPPSSSSPHDQPGAAQHAWMAGHYDGPAYALQYPSSAPPHQQAFYASGSSTPLAIDPPERPATVRPHTARGRAPSLLSASDSTYFPAYSDPGAPAPVPSAAPTPSTSGALDAHMERTPSAEARPPLRKRPKLTVRQQLAEARIAAGAARREERARENERVLAARREKLRGEPVHLLPPPGSASSLAQDAQSVGSSSAVHEAEQQVALAGSAQAEASAAVETSTSAQSSSAMPPPSLPSRAKASPTRKAKPPPRHKGSFARARTPPPVRTRSTDADRRDLPMRETRSASPKKTAPSLREMQAEQAAAAANPGRQAYEAQAEISSAHQGEQRDDDSLGRSRRRSMGMGPSLRELHEQQAAEAANPDRLAHEQRAGSSSVRQGEQRAGEPYPRRGGPVGRITRTSTSARGAEARLSSSRRGAPPPPLEGLQLPSVPGVSGAGRRAQDDFFVVAAAGPSQAPFTSSSSAPALLTSFSAAPISPLALSTAPLFQPEPLTWPAAPMPPVIPPAGPMDWIDDVFDIQRGRSSLLFPGEQPPSYARALLPDESSSTAAFVDSGSSPAYDAPGAAMSPFLSPVPPSWGPAPTAGSSAAYASPAELDLASGSGGGGAAELSTSPGTAAFRAELARQQEQLVGGEAAGEDQPMPLEEEEGGTALPFSVGSGEGWYTTMNVGGGRTDEQERGEEGGGGG
ncbi:hypothetical protein JCM10450v2_001763 [Rhodotorula kratochvilovae]